jgi:hypothetical protein
MNKAIEVATPVIACTPLGSSSISRFPIAATVRLRFDLLLRVYLLRRRGRLRHEQDEHKHEVIELIIIV